MEFLPCYKGASPHLQFSKDFLTIIFEETLLKPAKDNRLDSFSNNFHQ